MVAALLSVGPKAGAVIALGNLFTQVFRLDVVGAAPQQALVWLAALTMTVGNLQALRQTNLKRLLGYSSVAQLGTIVVGLAAGTVAGFGAVIFYALAYAITNIGAFTCLELLRNAGVREELESYTGLGKRSPFAAFLFTLFLLSLAGVPLLAGFAGKLFVFKSAVDAGLLTLAVVAVLNTVIAYAYYLRVVVAMWLNPADEGAWAVNVKTIGLVALGMAALGVVLVGTFPGPTLGVVETALGSHRAGVHRGALAYGTLPTNLSTKLSSICGRGSSPPPPSSPSPSSTPTGTPASSRANVWSLNGVTYRHRPYKTWVGFSRTPQLPLSHPFGERPARHTSVSNSGPPSPVA